MKNLIDLQKKLYPNLLDAMQQRYAVLHSIKLFQPIGRRGLAENTAFTERIVRSEVVFLQGQGLVNVTSKGMYITNEGNVVVEELASFMREVMGLNVLEKQMKEKLGVERVIVVTGNSDEFNWVKQEMGRQCVSYLKNTIHSDCTIAVTGGTTMSAVADAMVPLDKQGQCIFVPARGGIGEKVENEANSIVAKMAEQAKGDYRLLYVPEPLSESSYKTMINEPSIIQTLALIKSSDVILHGIGDALTMAKRRKTSTGTIQKLIDQQAVSEAFGYYFDQHGQLVHNVRTLGIQIEDLHPSKQVITIAGGKSKAKAITSYFKQGKSNLLITDEAAAQQILENE
ncbi:MAG TPA: sugar-binding domain-containing protein [Virgibacillus sp.]|nr:sugar-binding domain-containing protein [Virgibacillus sp.]